MGTERERIKGKESYSPDHVSLALSCYSATRTCNYVFKANNISHFSSCEQRLCHLTSLSDSHGYMHTVWAKAKTKSKVRSIAIHGFTYENIIVYFYSMFFMKYHQFRALMPTSAKNTILIFNSTNPLWRKFYCYLQNVLPGVFSPKFHYMTTKVSMKQSYAFM